MDRKSTWHVLALTVVCLLHAGCGSWFTGSSGSTQFHIDEKDWKDTKAGYINIDTVPTGAMASIRVTHQVISELSAGIDRRAIHQQSVVSEWWIAGSAPIRDVSVAISGIGRDDQIGKSMTTRYSISNIEIRLEKHGYQTRILNNVAPGALGASPLVVELVPEKIVSSLPIKK